jgi:hypothetical protein
MAPLKATFCHGLLYLPAYFLAKAVFHPCVGAVRADGLTAQHTVLTKGLRCLLGTILKGPREGIAKPAPRKRPPPCQSENLLSPAPVALFLDRVFHGHSV